MKNTDTTNVCPICDSAQLEIRHDRSVRYRYLKKDHVLDGQEHTACLDCGMSFYQPGQVERNNERFAAFEKSIVKGISPNELLALREKYLITQAQANQIFHCGPTAFSKWERGETAPTATAALLLQTALKDPELMKKLSEQAGVKIDIPATDKPVVHDHKNERLEWYAITAEAFGIERVQIKTKGILYKSHPEWNNFGATLRDVLVDNAHDELMSKWECHVKPANHPVVPSHFYAFSKR